MRDAPLNSSRFSKSLLACLFATLLAAPSITIGQEAHTQENNEATTTAEALPVAVTDTPISTATTTESDADSQRGQTGTVLGTTTDVSVEEEKTIEELPHPAVQATSTETLLSVRKFERRIILDKKAAHTCEAESFRIDISGKSSAQARIILFRDTDAPYEIEVGGLPYGIDILIAKNGMHRYTQGAEDRYLVLEIQNQLGSQKGDFSIPIVYTKKGVEDSSVVCQINLVNR